MVTGTKASKKIHRLLVNITNVISNHQEHANKYRKDLVHAVSATQKYGKLLGLLALSFMITLSLAGGFATQTSSFSKYDYKTTNRFAKMIKRHCFSWKSS